MIVLETSILSLAFRRRWVGPRPAAVDELQELIESNAALAVPAMAFQEVLSGVRTEPQFLELKGVLEGFPILLARPEEHLLAARISNLCARKGVAISAVDALIAGQTIAREGKLWTLDRDFVKLARFCGLKFHHN